MEPIVASSARKHGVADADLLHAYAHAFRVFDMDEDFVMRIGADSSGNLLEVGSVRSTSGDVIVHGMSARPKFLR